MKKLAIIGAGTRAEYIAIACRNLKVESHLFRWTIVTQRFFLWWIISIMWIFSI